MPSRQDQLHSYQFSMQRVVAALVMRETDPAQSPFRRAAGATLASILVALIIAAGFGVYAIFTARGSEGWRKPYSVVIEKETGAQFVFLDGRLRPALNFTSALLAGGGKPDVHTVPAKSLAGVPRGSEFGVPGLPESLPAADRLVGLPWSVCGVAGQGSARPWAVLAVGDQGIAGGGRGLTAEEVLVVRAVKRDNIDADTFVLWNNRLYPIKRDLAEDLYGPDVVRMPAAFTNAMPRGEEIAPVKVDRRGQRSQSLDDLTNGQVVSRVELNGTRTQFGIVTDKGLALITEMQAYVTLSVFGDIKEQAASVQQFADMEKADSLVPGAEPVKPPSKKFPLSTLSRNASVCAVLKDDSGNVEVRGDVNVPLAGRDRSVGDDDRQVVADYVLVEPGRGALVGSNTSTLLVTDRGVAHALARPDVAAMLGYEGKTPVRLPGSLAALIPSGPALDPDEVRHSGPLS